LPAEDIARISAMYDAEIRYSDGVLKELFSSLQKRQLLDNAVVIITADHGEEIGDHGGLLHGGTLYEELIKVPLIIWQSGEKTGRIEDHPVSTIDIAPTILRAAGLQIPKYMSGRDLLAIDNWPSEEEPATFVQYGRTRYAIRTVHWKLIHNQNPLTQELYDMKNDPDERVNLINTEPEIVNRLSSRLSAWRTTLPVNIGQHEETGMSSQEQQNLKALGYLQ
jgi:arylsulfatase A-like enzyme